MGGHFRWKLRLGSISLKLPWGIGIASFSIILKRLRAVERYGKGEKDGENHYFQAARDYAGLLQKRRHDGP